MIRIGFDLDGVLAMTQEHLLELLKDAGKVDKDSTIEDVRWWNYEYDPKTKTGFPNVTWEDMLAHFNDPEFWKTIAPYEQTRKAVNKLYELSEIHVVTDRCWFPELVQITNDWLVSNGFKFDSLEVCSGRDKWKYCVENRIQYFIDDKPANIRTIAPYVKGCYLYDQPWNRSETQLPKNAVKANLTEIMSDLRAFNEAAVLERVAARLVKDTTLCGGML